jgi:uncharacterized protein YdaU (DUF1376 family)
LSAPVVLAYHVHGHARTAAVGVRLMARRPSFQYYPGDFLSSPDVSTFTAAEVGGYWLLLSYAWQNEDCGLPDNDEVLARLSRLNEDWFGENGQRVRSKFRANEGRLYNLRLLEERAKQDDHRAKQSESGRRGAEKRWGKERREQPRDGDHAGDGNPNGVATEKDDFDGVAMGSPSDLDGNPIDSPMAKNSSSSSTSITPPISPSSGKPQTWDVVAFHRLRDEYPNPIHIEEARRVWIGLIDQDLIIESNVAEVFAGLDRWKRSSNWADEEGKYIPGLAKWLSGHRWQDHPRPLPCDDSAPIVSAEGNDPNATYQPDYRNPDGSLTPEAAKLSEEPWPEEDLPKDLM